jgi:lipopolysaccharide transport system ATP-binding protein
MSTPAIAVEALSKEYVIAGAGRRHDTLYDLMTHWLRLGTASRAAGEQGAPFLAMKDVSFAIQPGEVAGVIGRNGAGKSTLLKILSRITAPSSGRARIRGRVASLLEVGTGFHPELTGRENIYLNGAILGMTRLEVARKFDEIVAFAEIDRFVDTPVKRYSSGMYVRLAFSVAAHLETDVLLVDEVLAVGDALFQRKSLGKMSDAARSGRTVLFVSHNLAAVRSLCSRALLFDRGQLAFDGPSADGIAAYEKTFAAGGLAQDARFEGTLSDDVRFERMTYRQGGQVVDILDPQEEFELALEGRAERGLPSVEFQIAFFRDGVHIASCFDTERETPLAPGQFSSVLRFPGGVFRPGRYTIGIGASARSADWMWGSDVAVLDFSDNPGHHFAGRGTGVITIPHQGRRIQ